MDVVETDTEINLSTRIANPEDGLTIGHHWNLIPNNEATSHGEIMPRGLDELTDPKYGEIATEWGIDLDNLDSLVQSHIQYAGVDPNNPSVIFHSTSSAITGFRGGDMDAMKNERPMFRYFDFIPGRGGGLVRDGRDDYYIADVAQHEALEAMKEEGIEYNNIALDPEYSHYYHMNEALLVNLYEDKDEDEASLDQIVNAVKENPEIVFRVYTMDRATSMLLLRIHQLAGLQEQGKPLKVESNSPEISRYYNRKSWMYPKASEVKEYIDVPAGFKDESDFFNFLKEENQHSFVGRDLGFNHYERLPGYDLGRVSEYGFDTEIDTAIDRMYQMGLDTVCIKDATGTDGEMIYPGLSITPDNRDELYVKLEEIKRHSPNAELVMEAHVDYKQFEVYVDGVGVPLRAALSTHIMGGEPTEIITMQFIDEDNMWRGNVAFGLKDVQEHGDVLGITEKEYHRFMKFINGFAAATAQAGKPIIIGGFDAAVGTIRHRSLGNVEVVAANDPNLRFFGAMPALNSYQEHQNPVAIRSLNATANLDISLVKKVLRDIAESIYIADGVEVNLELITKTASRIMIQANGGANPEQLIEAITRAERALALA